MFTPILIAALKLIGLTGGGYLLFSIPVLRRRLLQPLLFVTMNGLLPVYFVHRLPMGWAGAMAGGWYWMAGFFVAYFAMTAVHVAIGTLLVRRSSALRAGGERRRIFIAICTVHNAGFIPLPILEVIAPPAITVYMFMYVLGFSLVMWSVAVPMVSGGGSIFRLRLNGPLVGVLVGLAVAASGLYPSVPAAAREALGSVGDIALDCVLVTLGGILATIPRAQLRVEPEFRSLALVRFLLYPAVLLLVAILLPLDALSPEMQWGLRVALVLQGVTPPATSLMLVAKRFGSAENTAYLGSGILLTYLLSFVTIPLFLVVSTLLFRSG